MTTTAPPPAQLIEWHDPATLLIDTNIRPTDLDDDFVESIRDQGVLQALTGYRTAGGPVRIRYGHRRAVGAITADRQWVPVHVVADEAAGDDIERILGQYAENTYRRGLNAADQAGVVVQLLDLGLSPAQVHKRTRLPKGTIAAAKAVRASQVATAAAAQKTWLTLDQAAALAEFDASPAAVDQLAGAAQEGDGPFRHQLQKLRDERAHTEAHAAAVTELEAAGVKVLASSPGFEYYLTSLTGPDGELLTEDGHRSCPGHAAVLSSGWIEDIRRAEWRPRYLCTDPQAHGHKPVGGDNVTDLAAEREQRQQLLEGNRAWRSAETVRRTWLAELAGRKRAPDGALRFVIESICRGDGEVHRALAGSQPMACELLSLTVPPGRFGRVTPALEGLAQAADSRRILAIGLMVILAAYEEETDAKQWREPGSYDNTARYFAALANWGYHLSDIEQGLVDARAKEQS